MITLVERIKKSHSLKKAIDRDILEIETDGMTVVYHDHYETPRFSVFPEGVPRESVDFALIYRDKLALLDRAYCGDIEEAKIAMGKVLGVEQALIGLEMDNE